MRSLFSKLYLDMQTRITEAVPEVKWIEQDFEQESAEWRPNVQFPAVLIDFPQADFSQLGGANQWGDVRISARLLFAPFSQSYQAAPDEVKEKALEYFEVERKLVAALHNWMPPEGYCQPLVRRSVSSNNRNDIGLRIRALQFDTAAEWWFG